MTNDARKLFEERDDTFRMLDEMTITMLDLMPPGRSVRSRHVIEELGHGIRRIANRTTSRDGIDFETVFPSGSIDNPNDPRFIATQAIAGFRESGIRIGPFRRGKIIGVARIVAATADVEGMEV
ncbi:hypothetical protein KBC31_00565 [Candidatus Saccharibacteria bacterium]|nr:hypothetical protein [Candidatus Saccharibacteria bacterium]